MPKNKGKNAFYFFMLDWKEREEARGRVFPGGLRDVQCDQQCSEKWQSLTAQQKGVYTAQAKQSKVEAQGSIVKKTALGERLDEIIAIERREQEFQENMLQYIDSVVSIGTQHKNLEKIKFIFIHVNWFFRREIGINKYDYCPAEFAIAEFSLEKGIENVYHEIVNAKIPLGWRRDAIETSQQTHRIPIELKEGQNDFTYIYDKLTSLLEANKTGDKYPPIFTVKDVTLAVDSLLTRLTCEAQADKEKFLIYSLETLFGTLRNAAAQNVNDSSIPLVVAEREFNKDIFSSVTGLECEFHKIIDGTSPYCSMAIVKRWGFTICDYCCELLGMQMIEGIHTPTSVQTFDAMDKDSLHLRFSNLEINNQKVISMNCVTEEHRIKVSERTHMDEEKRRNKCQTLDIIDHSKVKMSNSNTTPGLSGRPLRLPNTKSQAVINYEKNIPLNNSDFPPLGRGTLLKKKKNYPHLPLGRGHGNL